MTATARLVCHDPDTAEVARAHLLARRARDVTVDGSTLVVDLHAHQVRKLARDALKHGFAAKAECTRLLEEYL